MTRQAPPAGGSPEQPVGGEGAAGTSDRGDEVRQVERDAPSRPIACVDLNGVLDTYIGDQGPRHYTPMRPGAPEFLAALRARGFDVVVFTTRWADDVWAWLREQGLAHLVTAVTDRKPPAHVFIDDRAVCFRGDFARTLREIETFTAHWERTPDA
jgi:hypothetical protein